MDDQQKHRERAYKIWEDEGRPDGQHDEHWRRAEAQHEATEQDAAEITAVNQQTAEKFKGKGKNAGSPTDIRPPSTIAPD